MRKIIDLKGCKFNRLEVLEFAGKNKYNRTIWKCKCDCGKIRIVVGYELTGGHTKSCGCLSADLSRQRHRKEKGQSGFTQAFLSYKKRAKKKNINFELTKEEFRHLTQLRCFYCNGNFSNKRTLSNGNLTQEGIEHGMYTYNGLDRLDNTKGYTLDNVVPCCKYCNRAKDTMSIETFKNWIIDIYSHYIEGY